jgi:hypothetical protein
VIDDAEDCPHAQQFKCDDFNSWPLENCFCDLDAPLTPQDCELATQFHCEVWSLEAPWGCSCNLDAPAGPEACASPSNFSCARWEPEFVDCACECDWGAPTPQGDEDCANWGPYECEFQPFGCCCHIQLG